MKTIFEVIASTWTFLNAVLAAGVMLVKASLLFIVAAFFVAWVYQIFKG